MATYLVASNLNEGGQSFGRFDLFPQMWKLKASLGSLPWAPRARNLNLLEYEFYIIWLYLILTGFWKVEVPHYQEGRLHF